MARTGRFGRLPRAAPDLSSAIASLLREMQTQEDQNFLDAWTNGGSVDGKVITDARLLAHFKQRRNALSPDDPLWDEWNNRIDQYEFAIADSKMSLKWDQHKVSERDMSAFYSNWANKVPANSAFGRELASKAAKWLTAANQRKKTETAEDKQANHDQWVKNFYDGHVKVGETVQARLVQIAKVYGAMPVSGDGLEDLNPDSEGYGRFMDIYTDGRTNDPYVQDLIDDVEREARRIDPGFRFDKRHIDSALRRADEGYGTLVSRSLFKTERDDWQQRRGTMRHSQNTIEQVPAIKRIFDVQQLFNEETRNCQGDPTCDLKAVSRLRDRITKQGEKLMRGGADAVNVEIVAAVAATQRQLDAVMAGKPIDITKAAAADTTIFDLNAPGESRGWFVSHLSSIVQRNKAIDEGGWIDTVPQTDGNNQPILDDNGEMTYLTRIHHKEELIPANLVEVKAPGLLDGGPSDVRFYGEPIPVVAQGITPTGELLAPADWTPMGKDAEGNPVPLDATQAPPALYYVVKGVPGPDGEAIDMYRTGQGSADSPFAWSDTAPVYIDPVTKQPITPRADLGGAAVIPIQTTMTQDPATGRVGFVADYTPLLHPQIDPKPLPSGMLPLGFSYTPTGAYESTVVGGMHDRGDHADADRQAQSYVDWAMRTADQNPNPIEADVERLDAGQLGRSNELRMQHGSGVLYDDYLEAQNAITADNQPLADKLRAAGVTESVVGFDEFARRVGMLADLRDWSARQPKPMSELGPDAEAWAERYAQWDVDPGIAANRKAARKEAAILNPQQLVQKIKVPGYTPPEAEATPASKFGDWLRGLTATPPEAFPGASLYKNPLSPIGSGSSMTAKPFPDPVQPMAPKTSAPLPRPVQPQVRQPRAGASQRASKNPTVQYGTRVGGGANAPTVAHTPTGDRYSIFGISWGAPAPQSQTAYPRPPAGGGVAR